MEESPEDPQNHYSRLPLLNPEPDFETTNFDRVYIQTVGGDARPETPVGGQHRSPVQVKSQSNFSR